MGARFRKSINLGGGFRINISKSGVGYSWGVKGYRVTKTAKGTTRRTASIPGTGLSYSTETSNKRRTSKKQIDQSERTRFCDANAPTYRDISGQEIMDIQKINPADINSLMPAEYADLFNQTRRIRIIHLILIICAIVSLFINPLLSILFFVVAIIIKTTQKVTLNYEFDDYSIEKWNAQNAAWHNLVKCKKIWFITTKFATESKSNAGAAEGTDIEEAKVRRRLPWYLKTDLRPLILKLKTQKLVFMPDRLLIIKGLKFGALNYSDIRFQFGIQPMAGNITVPRETEIMEYRWIKVNKDGSKDMRFKGNKQIPVYKLGFIEMISNPGLNVTLLASRTEPVDSIERLMS